MRSFRYVLLCSFLSQIGVWMQTVVLGAYVYSQTDSPLAVGLITFAQLGPMLFLPTVGGWLTDRLDVRKYILTLQFWQVLCVLTLAFVLHQPQLHLAQVFACVLGIGLANALIGPAWGSSVPSLVPPADLRAAVSLNSTQMNLARVIGPAIGGMLFPIIGASGVIAINAACFIFIMSAVYFVRFPPRRKLADGESGIGGGIAMLKTDPYIRRIVLSMFALALLTLTFLYQMPTIAAQNFGMDVESSAYGWLYACLGGGAVTGALALSTVLVKRDPFIVVTVGLIGVTLMLAMLIFARLDWMAYALVFILGISYQIVVISLNASAQTHVPLERRGHLMGLWMTAFGGTVPIGMLIAGAVAQKTSITVVIAYGCITAAIVTWVLRPKALRKAERESNALTLGA
ncbi:MAG: MFS transporter [Actinomycetota bacterium]|nr:MFS transporter [Actinomycetota bacterium]MDP2287285.1 MFS transporter [Actinomycetota bacterium]